MTTPSAGDLLPVSLNTILEGGQIDCDFYLADASKRLKLYRGRGYPFTEHDVAQLKSKGIKCLYIAANDAGRYRDHVRSRIVNDRSIPTQRRFEIMREASRTVVEEAWQQGGIDASVGLAGELAEQLTSLITSEEVAFQDLLELMLHDYSAYAHATNVCSFAVILAQAHGIGQHDDLVQIAKGALLHDIGKQLSGDGGGKRRQHMRVAGSTDHTIVGFQKLSASPEMSWGTLMMIYQHHEQIDGRGRPVGLVGDEIHEWARICAVANFYEMQLRLHQAADTVNVHHLSDLLEQRAGETLDGRIVASMCSLVEKERLPV